MPWSTRELAELSGTTVNTVRHYHRIGLLLEPDRRYNGYKQYEVRHLVTLLRIRRLADLGVPLSQIGEVSARADSTPETLRALDTELEMSIERLDKARREIAAILQDSAPPDAPAGFASVASRLSDADYSMLHILTQLYDQDALNDVQKMVETDTKDLDDDLGRLSAEADEETRHDLVERLTRTLAHNLIEYPWLSDPVSHLSKSVHVAAETLADAVTELYNPAQLDVFARAGTLAAEQVRVMHEQGKADASPSHAPDGFSQLRQRLRDL